MTIQNLTDEQRAFVETIRDFAKRECGTREQRDALTDNGGDPHNQEMYERIAELGWLGVAIPEQYGGSGGGAVDMCLLCEEFARGLIPMGFFSVSMITAGAVGRFGTEELKQEILGGVARGRVEAIAMSEPEAGSDVGNLSCKAERVNGGYVINGQKTWITARPRRGSHPARVPHRPDRQQARGAVDDLRADRCRAGSTSAGSTRWAGVRSTTCSSPTATSAPIGLSASRTTAGCS